MVRNDLRNIARRRAYARRPHLGGRVVVEVRLAPVIVEKRVTGANLSLSLGNSSICRSYEDLEGRWTGLITCKVSLSRLEAIDLAFLKRSV